MASGQCSAAPGRHAATRKKSRFRALHAHTRLGLGHSPKQVRIKRIRKQRGGDGRGRLGKGTERISGTDYD
eukprot:4525785-Pleurochrysis_carterae.AAC.1